MTTEEKKMLSMISRHNMSIVVKEHPFDTSKNTIGLTFYIEGKENGIKSFAPKNETDSLVQVLYNQVIDIIEDEKKKDLADE
jgi:hypothetical protein